MRLAYVLVLAFILTAGCGVSKNHCPDCGISHDDILNFYEVDISEFRSRVSRAFIKIEDEVLNLPNPDDNKPVGPHPDVNKCPCEGSGKIRHGDGHTTPCPYHSGEFNTPKLEVEDGKISYYKKNKDQ